MNWELLKDPQTWSQLGGLLGQGGAAAVQSGPTGINNAGQLAIILGTLAKGISQSAGTQNLIKSLAGSGVKSLVSGPSGTKVEYHPAESAYKGELQSGTISNKAEGEAQAKATSGGSGGGILGAIGEALGQLGKNLPTTSASGEAKDTTIDLSTTGSDGSYAPIAPQTTSAPSPSSLVTTTPTQIQGISPPSKSPTPTPPAVTAPSAQLAPDQMQRFASMMGGGQVPFLEALLRRV